MKSSGGCGDGRDGTCGCAELFRKEFDTSVVPEDLREGKCVCYEGQGGSERVLASTYVLRPHWLEGDPKICKGVGRGGRERKRRNSPEEPEAELTFVRSTDVARGGNVRTRHGEASRKQGGVNQFVI